MHVQAQALSANLGKLSPKDQDFAKSLLKSAAKGKATEKQLHWIGELAKRATTPPKPVESIKVAHKLDGVLALFSTAAQHLQRPKLLLAIAKDAGLPTLRLALNGAASKNPGDVSVTDRGSFGNSRYFGRLTKAGDFIPSKAEAEHSGTISAALCALAMDPVGIASTYGRSTGECCFCSRTLSDPLSVQLGYGPICAKHYGLPH